MDISRFRRLCRTAERMNRRSKAHGQTSNTIVHFPTISTNPTESATRTTFGFFNSPLENIEQFLIENTMTQNNNNIIHLDIESQPSENQQGEQQKQQPSVATNQKKVASIIAAILLVAACVGVTFSSPTKAQSSATLPSLSSGDLPSTASIAGHWALKLNGNRSRTAGGMARVTTRAIGLMTAMPSMISASATRLAQR